MFIEFIKRVGERDKMRGLPSIYLFFATSLINSIIQEHECDIKVTLKTHCCRKNDIILSLCTQGCY